MSINQHPSSEWLSAYSAGSLSLSQSLCVAAHMESCSVCQQTFARLNQLGGELITELNPAIGSTLNFEQLMDSINKQESAAEQKVGTALPISKPRGSIPLCLRKFIPVDYDHLQWSRISPSIQSTQLCQDYGGSKVELLRIKPGGSAPTHTHLGDELTVILEGSFSDEKGIYRAGDFLACDGSNTHTPVASKDRDCICLVVSEAPLQFTGWFTRLFNPLLRRGYA
jgi:putative transcriptional regulator|tara:strand:- start:1673 stop:2347 length:675 start_codon:yes stop_codon:yes gene_type:complete